MVSFAIFEHLNGRALLQMEGRQDEGLKRENECCAMGDINKWLVCERSYCFMAVSVVFNNPRSEITTEA